jgi:hypothetical protein
MSFNEEKWILRLLQSGQLVNFILNAESRNVMKTGSIDQFAADLDRMQKI